MHACGVVVHSPHQQQQQKWESHRRLLLLYRKSTNLKLAKVRTRMWLVGSRYQRSVLAPFVFTSGKHILEKTGVRLFALRFMFLNGMTTRRCCATHTHTPVVSHSPKSLFLLYSCIINSNRFLAPSFFKHCTVAGAPLPLAMHTITHTLVWAWAYTLALLHPHAHHSTHLILQTEWERERESHVRAYECLMKILYHQNNLKAHLLYARNTKNGQQQQQQICIFCLHSELCEITHKDNNLRAGKIWGAMASARSLDIVIAFVIIRMSPESAFSR